MSIPNEWISTSVRDLASDEPYSFIDGDWIEAPHITISGIRLIQTGNIGIGKFIDTNKKFISESSFRELKCKDVYPGDLLICRLADPIGRSCIVPNLNSRALTSVDVCILRVAASKFDRNFIVHALNQMTFLKNCQESSGGSTRQRISRTNLGNIEVLIPKYKFEQSKIGEVLSTVDRAIEQTEALIAKQQRIMAGLMQDLLTRGIDEQGNLRSEETHEFKDSPLGRIPAEWKVDELGKLVDSAVDGPFGSNLKTEHYVTEPGVRVIRLQNIGNGEFIDDDKAWISKEHASRLARHSVTTEDILVGSLGDDKRLFGRACLYPNTSQPAIVKADVFRIRCKREVMVHDFAFRLFNLPRWRQGLFGLAQGVTRDRVNLTNLLLLKLPVPSKEEQKKSASLLDAQDQLFIKLRLNLSKLHYLKTALMQDLLTGKRRVTSLLSRPEEASA